MALNFCFVAVGHAVAVAPDIKIEIRTSDGPGSATGAFPIFRTTTGAPWGEPEPGAGLMVSGVCGPIDAQVCSKCHPHWRKQCPFN
jgi:hypothetical protein